MTASIQRFLDGLTVASVATTLVDVALVYYLIYRLLLTIRGTRAAQMIVGIVLIGAAFFVAQRVELTTVSWLLDNFISYFIILIIVVFQQDIRRALGRLGQIQSAPLVIVGANDSPDIRAVADTIIASIPGSKLVVIQNAGHFVNLDHPGRFDEALVNWLLGVP